MYPVQDSSFFTPRWSALTEGQSWPGRGAPIFPKTDARSPLFKFLSSLLRSLYELLAPDV